jgi:hypothetical protein
MVVVPPAVGKGAQGVDEIAHRGEGPAADGLLGDDAEGNLDKLEPRIRLTSGFSSSCVVCAWPMHRRGTLRQIDVQPADVPDLGLSLEVGGEGEGFDVVRLDAPLAPDPSDGGKRDAQMLAE